MRRGPVTLRFSAISASSAVKDCLIEVIDSESRRREGPLWLWASCQRTPAKSAPVGFDSHLRCQPHRAVRGLASFPCSQPDATNSRPYCRPNQLLSRSIRSGTHPHRALHEKDPAHRVSVRGLRLPCGLDHDQPEKSTFSIFPESNTLNNALSPSSPFASRTMPGQFLKKISALL